MKAKHSLAKKQKGFTLLEIMLALVVASLLIYAVFVIFRPAQEGANTQSAQNNLFGLHAGAKRICPRPGNCLTLDAAQVIQSGQAPSDMVNGSGASATLVSPWGEAVTVAIGSVGAGTNNAYIYTFNGVPRSECNTFVSSVQNNFAEVTVGTTTVKDASTPYSTAAAVTACDNDTNNLVFAGT